jgi:hypothetical protein
MPSHHTAPLTCSMSHSRRYPLHWLSLLSLAAASTGGCHLTGPDGCDLCTTSGVVYGVVRDDTGVPVANAAVRIQAFFADSTQARTTVAVGHTNLVARTNATGAYRDQPFSFDAPFRASLVVVVTLPSDGTVALVLNAAEVEFRSDYHGPARDSVRVDVVVPRRSLP